MGGTVFSGRYTVTNNDEKLVVFIIGMRINKWWAVHKWLPVLLAMPPMIRELYMNKELGCLSMENFTRWRTTLLIQYWKSEEHLMTYARGQKHLKAWADFNKKVGNNDSVGIYHETYSVPKGNYETIYGNMPKFGLGRAKGTMAITSSTKSAEKRLRKSV